MTPYSQKDKKYASLLIGDTKLTIRNYGCLVVSLSSFIDTPPDKVLKILNQSHAFNGEGMVLHDTAAKVLKLIYRGFSITPSYPSIGCTSHYAKDGFLQHFCLCIDKDNYMNPLTGKVEKGGYKFQSWRLYAKRILNG